LKSGIRLLLTPLAAAVLALSAAGAAAQVPSSKSASGTLSNGITWEAQSFIVGTQTTGSLFSTAGNAAYHPSYPGIANGVVGLTMSYAAGSFICTGTLLPDRLSILTAAHCVSDGFGPSGPINLPNATTVRFQPQNGLGVGTSIFSSTAAVAIPVAGYTIHPQYTGQVIDQNDIAILRLASPAPAWAPAFDIYVPPAGLTGEVFNVWGYGNTGAGSAGTGLLSITGRLRQGDNRFDFRWGDPDWNGVWDGAFDNPALPAAMTTFSYLSDFDNGNSANDASCLVAASEGLGGAKYCNTGLGLREVGLGGGDSGGPSFINGRIASINSYGLTFGVDFGDAVAGINSSFGEFSGYVPVYIHADFINAALIPEPGTYGLMALGLLGVAAAARRRRQD
jgi:hypothetical protein